MAKKNTEFLTIAELEVRIPQEREKLEAIVQSMNEAEEIATFNKLENEMKDLKKELNGHIQDLELLRCMDGVDSITAMRKIIMRSTYIGVAVRSEDREGTKVWYTEPNESLIDLMKVWGTKEKATDLSRPWRYKAELACLYQTGATACNIGKDDETYQRDLAKFFKLSKEAREKAGNPSTRKTLDVIREVISAMIGEEYGAKAISCDANYFDCGFTTVDKNARNKVRTADMRQCVKLLFDMSRRIMTSGAYNVETKNLTKDGKKWQENLLSNQATADKVSRMTAEEKQKLIEMLTKDDAVSEPAPETPADLAPDPVSEEKPKTKKTRSKKAKADAAA